MTKGRIEAFSDGIFAIAATLLVLEIKVPAPGDGSLWHGLAQLWPSFAAYGVSFFTIGIIWVNHHGQYDRLVRMNRTMLFVNLLLLFWVAFIPFPTALVAEYLRDGSTSAQHVAAAVYSGTLLVMGLSFFAGWRYAVHAGLLQEDTSSVEVRYLLRRNRLGQVGYALAVVLSFVSAGLAVAICGLVAAYYVYPGRPPKADGR